MIERAIILATGSPAHHSQLAYSRPRAMLPALGKPLVVRMMNRLYRCGIYQYVVVVGVNEGEVAAYLNNQWVPNAKIEFVLKAQNDSLYKVLVNIAKNYQKPFLICSYNTFTHPNFPEVLMKHHEDTGKPLILSGAPSTLSKSQQQFFARKEEGKVTAVLIEKPADTKALITLTDLALCGSDFVDYLSSAQIQTNTFNHQLKDIIAAYVTANGTTQIAETSWVLQVESDHDLLTLNKMLLDEGQDAHILSELPYTAQITPPVRIDPQVSVGQGAKIGPYVYLERGCTIGHEAVVKNSIILQQAKVPARTTINDSIISARGPVT